MRARASRSAAALGAAVMLFGAIAGCDRNNDAAPGHIPTVDTSRWQRIADAPTARQEVAAAQVRGESIYVVGGLLADGSATTAVEIYHPVSNRWSAGPPLPVAVHHAMAVWTSKLGLVVMGGFERSLSGRATDAVFALQSGRWVTLPHLRRTRGAGAAVIWGERIIVLGGISGGNHIAPVEIFDGTTWRDGAPMPTPRDHLAAATDIRFVYAAGGRRGSEQIDAFESYEPHRDRWTRLPDIPTPRSGFGGAFLRGCHLFTRSNAPCFVTVGGEGPRIFGEFEAYNPVDRVWGQLPGLGVPRHGIGLVETGTVLYALVGGVKVGLAPSRVSEAFVHSARID